MVAIQCAHPYVTKRTREAQVLFDSSAARLLSVQAEPVLAQLTSFRLESRDGRAGVSRRRAGLFDPSNVNPQIARLIPEDFARSHEAGAIDISGNNMTLAMVAPDDIETIAEVELMTGYQIRPAVAMPEDVRALISRIYDDRSVARQTIVDMKITELREDGIASEDAAASIMTADQEDAPVDRLVQAILSGAVTAGASDVHLEPFKPEMRVRYRVDGHSSLLRLTASRRRLSPRNAVAFGLPLNRMSGH